MGKHQIIYTSCKRGIDPSRHTDGMQIYSHNVDFKKRDSIDVKGLFAYQTPTLPVGASMTEELALTMPVNFLFRCLDGDSCAVALNTYLGRDYMGSTGRFGNHFSHAIICDEAEFNVYPCEIYGSNSLLKKAPEGVKSADVPSFLPEPDLSRGGMIYPESTSEFLAEDNRIESYKKMLAAMLMYKSAKKRVIICDSPENIIKWIAALHFTLPLKIALTVNFATYDYDPSLSASRICGVLPEGTRYSPSNASNHFTFDFINGIMPDITAEGDFFDFIDMGMSLSFDSVRDFHEFVSTKLTYAHADEQYYQIYSLYCLLSDGIDNMPLETFKNAVKMAYDYSVDKRQTELVEKLLANKDFVFSSTDAYTMEVVRVLVNNIDGVSRETQESIKALFAEKTISFFAVCSASESDFKRLYSEIESIGNLKCIEIPSELMKDSNRRKILSVLRDSKQWQLDFMADKLCGYITLKGIVVDEFFAEHPMGKLLAGITALSVSGNADEGFELILKCLQRFSSNWKQFIFIGLGVESGLQKSSDTRVIINKLWAHIIQFIAKKHSTNKQTIYAFLLLHKRYEQAVALYKEWMTSAGSIEAAKALLQEQLGQQDLQYIRLHSAEICECYYEFMKKSNKVKTLAEEKEFLELILQKDIPFGLIDQLAESAISDVQIPVSSEKHQELIRSITVYYRNQNNKTHYTGRLMVLIAGMVLSRNMHGKTLTVIAKEVKASAGGKAVNLALLSPKELERYIDWIIPSLLRNCKTPDDLLSVYALYGHTTDSASGFISLCAKESLKELKDRNTALGVYLFLELLFKYGSDDDRIETGKLFSKLKKGTLDNINSYAAQKFADNEEYKIKLGEVYGIATKAIPVPKKGGFFFKSKK